MIMLARVLTSHWVMRAAAIIKPQTWFGWYGQPLFTVQVD